MKSKSSWLRVSSSSVLRTIGDICSILFGRRSIFLVYTFIVKDRDNKVLNVYRHRTLLNKPFISGLFPISKVRLNVRFSKQFAELLKTTKSVGLQVIRSIVDSSGRDNEAYLWSLLINDTRPIMLVDLFSWEDAYIISQSK